LPEGKDKLFDECFRSDVFWSPHKNPTVHVQKLIEESNATRNKISRFETGLRTVKKNSRWHSWITIEYHPSQRKQSIRGQFLSHQMFSNIEYQELKEHLELLQSCLSPPFFFYTSMKSDHSTDVGPDDEPMPAFWQGRHSWKVFLTVIPEKRKQTMEKSGTSDLGSENWSQCYTDGRKNRKSSKVVRNGERKSMRLLRSLWMQGRGPNTVLPCRSLTSNPQATWPPVVSPTRISGP